MFLLNVVEIVDLAQSFASSTKSGDNVVGINTGGGDGTKVVSSPLVF